MQVTNILIVAISIFLYANGTREKRSPVKNTIDGNVKNLKTKVVNTFKDGIAHVQLEIRGNLPKNMQDYMIPGYDEDEDDYYNMDNYGNISNQNNSYDNMDMASSSGNNATSQSETKNGTGSSNNSKSDSATEQMKTTTASTEKKPSKEELLAMQMKQDDDYYEAFSNSQTDPSSILMVATSFDSSVTELFDVSDANHNCKPFNNTSIFVTGATGALMKGRYPLICGGWIDGATNECYILGQSTPIAYMSTTRYRAASIPLSKTELLVTGGLGPGYKEVITSDIVNIDGTVRRGPDLPMKLVYHCFTKINETLALLTGGLLGSHYSKRVWFFDIPKMTWWEGPNMIITRGEHACGSFIDPFGRHFAIVTGGLNDWDQTELIDLSNAKSWFQPGWDLPIRLHGLNMVSTPDGGSVIAMGGYIGKEQPMGNFYRLNCTNVSCTWKKLPHQMKHPRRRFVSFYVPAKWC